MKKMIFVLIIFISNTSTAFAQTKCLTDADYRSTTNNVEALKDLTNDQSANSFHRASVELQKYRDELAACRQRRSDALFSLESCLPEINAYNSQVGKYNQLQAELENQPRYLMMIRLLENKLLRPPCDIE